MLRRNFDFFAIAAIFFGMALVQHIPPPRAVAQASVIRFQDAVVHDRCPLLDSILSIF
jgi:hypothetical protein